MKTPKHRKNLFIILSYIMLIAMIPSAMFLSKQLEKSLQKQIQSSIENEAVLCTEMIEKQYQNDILLLESLAMRMATALKENPEVGLPYLVSTAERYGMKRIAFSETDGQTLTTDGKQTNNKDKDSFKKALEGETVLTEVIIDTFGNDEVNVYSRPVYDMDTDEIIGVLSFVYPSEVFKELLSVASFNGEGYTYIINSKGDVIINSSHHNAMQDVENIFDSMHTIDDEHMINALKNGIENRQQSFFEVGNKDNIRLACCMPLSVNDWFLVCAVPKKLADNIRNNFMRKVFIFCAGVSVVAIFGVVGIHCSQKEKRRLLEEALYVDPLTGGRTYAKFCIDCRQKLDEQKDKKAVCVYLDLDNYNLVSTLYADEEMDEIICNIYRLLLEKVGRKGIVCRNNVDQFCVMYFYTDSQELENDLNQFIDGIKDSQTFENMLRPSMGIYVVEHYSERIEDMVNKARTAHETIKQNSDSIIAYYDESFRNTMYENRHLEDEMEVALKNHEFQPYIQPKYSAADGTVCGGEALIRWVTSDGKIIPPFKFISLAENNGFIRKLDREMFNLVCVMQKYFLEKGKKPLPISVNVSRQLMYDSSFADDYHQMMQDMGIPSELIELEITESVLFEDMDVFSETLEKLRKYGFRILMDDFGTGYSSLMMLKTMPIDEIKLDKSFVDDYNDEKGSCIISCVLDLAKMLDLPVVAEGVETKDQYLYLKDKGCKVIQGYYFSKPLPAVEYMKMIMN